MSGPNAGNCSVWSTTGMLSKAIRILDLDGSVTTQKSLTDNCQNQIVGLRDIGPYLRFWTGRRWKNELERRIAGSDRNALTFIGSGDFHHLSDILINRFDEEICVIDFDFHPDWTILVPWLSCGSWVTNALRRKNIVKVIMAGVSSSEASGFSIYSGNFASLKDDRVELYPYSHRPSRVYFRKIPDNVSIEVTRGVFSSLVNWNELKSKNLVEFFLHIIRRLPVKKVYISIDKDCLKKKYALTNWQEGRLGLEELLVMIKIIRENCDIAGADICGDYSPPAVKGFAKRIVSYLDHPKDYTAKGADAEHVSEINLKTNLKLAEALL
jgi:hypothetical protein